MTVWIETALRQFLSGSRANENGRSEAVAEAGRGGKEFGMATRHSLSNRDLRHILSDLDESQDSRYRKLAAKKGGGRR